MSEDAENNQQLSTELSFLKQPQLVSAKPLSLRTKNTEIIGDENGKSNTGRLATTSSPPPPPLHQRVVSKDTSITTFPTKSNNINNNSSSSNNNQKITIEYERVGSFQVFETICPLECIQILPDSLSSVTNDNNGNFIGSNNSSMKEMDKENVNRTLCDKNRNRGKTSKKTSLIAAVPINSKSNSKNPLIHIKKKPTTTNENDNNQNHIESESSDEDELTAAFKEKMHQMETQQLPKSINITLDAFFRTENPNCTEPTSAEASVFWARGDSLNIQSKTESVSNNRTVDGESDSDLDPEIEKYILAQQEKKQEGESVTGESLWYDQERSIIRNLHDNGSISLTSYGDTDEKIFGKAEIFDTILTSEERAILRAPIEEEPHVKVEKKEKPLVIKKKVKKQQPARPKDQGDWL